MDQFYVTLPSDLSVYYFAANTITVFRNKLVTTLELENDRFEVGLVEISYPKRHKKRFWHNTLHLGTEEIIFHVKHYKSVFDIQIYSNLLNRLYKKALTAYLAST